MSMAPNPILGEGPAHLLLSEHVRFRMAEHRMEPDIVHELSTARTADFKVDATSGNLVFRIKGYRVVAKRLDDGRFMILSLFSDDQKLA